MSELFETFMVDECVTQNRESCLIFFTTDDAEAGKKAYETLTGNMIKETCEEENVSEEDIVGYCICISVTDQKDGNEIIEATIAPTMEEENCFVDFGHADIIHGLEELEQFVNGCDYSHAQELAARVDTGHMHF